MSLNPGAANPLDELSKAAFFIAKSAVASGITRDSIRAAASALWEIEERAIEGPSRQGGSPVACKPGCDHCCYEIAYGTPLEIVGLADVIKSSWTPDRIEDLVERLRAYQELLDRHRDEAFLRFRSACPLLERGLCSMHPYRPSGCHGRASMDAELCQLRKDAVHPTYVIEPPNREDLRAEAVASGINEALKRSGIKSETMPVVPLLLALLTNETEIGSIASWAPRYNPAPEPDWRIQVAPGPIRVPPATNDPIARSIEKRIASEPPEAYLPTLKPDKTVHLLLRMLSPGPMRTPEEALQVQERINDTIYRAMDSPHWNALEAYANLSVLEVARNCYGGLDMRAQSAKLGRLLHERVAKPLAPELLAPLGPRAPGKVRVGVASRNIRRGSAASWALGWVKNFDRSLFEVTVVNLGGEEDADSYRFKDAADRYVRFGGDTLAIARKLRELGLDYLIYPDLGDGGWNFPFAIFRLARRQACGWGCPFTSGLPAVDDYLGSELMEPDGAEAHYTENLVRLPNTGISYARRLTGLKHVTRKDFGLPDGHLILVAQQLDKWTPQRDEILASISERSPNPLVVMMQGGDYSKAVFTERMRRAGVRFTPFPLISLPIFLRFAQLCDVSLDPPDFSGGHTAYAMLQVGNPVVTLPGEFARGRQGLAYVQIAGAPGLVANSADDYVDLATNPDRLQAACQILNPEPLFEDLAPVRALEHHILSTM